MSCPVRALYLKRSSTFLVNYKFGPLLLNIRAPKAQEFFIDFFLNIRAQKVQANTSISVKNTQLEGIKLTKIAENSGFSRPELVRARTFERKVIETW